METKQTAVEWLMNELTKKRKYYTNNAILTIYKNSLQERRINELFQQAKAMHKEQIMEAAHHGVDFENSPFENAEQYYNGTYGNNEKN